jgi:hypothetical protein
MEFIIIMIIATITTTRIIVIIMLACSGHVELLLFALKPTP